MALSAKSLFLFGYSVGVSNQNLDFKAVSGGPVITAKISLGQYSLTTLMTAIASALNVADPAHTYTVVADRTLMGGTQNKVFISTNGIFLSLLFGTGPNLTSSISSLIGFNATDYTGNTAYSGSQSTGSILIPAYLGYNYLDVNNQAKVFGAVNVSASGLKEAVVFNIQKFIDIEFRYETKASLTAWVVLFNWLIQQSQFDFTPEISSPNTFYQCTLEKTQYDSKGLGFQMKEMLPNFPNIYQTGPLNFRVTPNILATQFIS